MRVLAAAMLFSLLRLLFPLGPHTYFYSSSSGSNFAVLYGCCCNLICFPVSSSLFPSSIDTFFFCLHEFELQAHSKMLRVLPPFPPYFPFVKSLCSARPPCVRFASLPLNEKDSHTTHTFTQLRMLRSQSVMLVLSLDKLPLPFLFFEYHFLRV